MIASQISELEDVADYYKLMAHLLKLISSDTTKRRRRSGDKKMKRLKGILTNGIKKERLDIEDTRYLLSVVLESNPRMFGAHDFLISEKEIVVPEKPKPAPRSQTKEPKTSHPQSNSRTNKPKTPHPQSSITKIKKWGLNTASGFVTVCLYLILSFALLVLGMLLYMLSQYEKPKKRVKKPAPRINSPLTCHQPIIKKTLYVKSSTTNKLTGSRGNKIRGLISKSGVQDIQIERKTGQPTVM